MNSHYKRTIRVWVREFEAMKFKNGNRFTGIAIVIVTLRRLAL